MQERLVICDNLIKIYKVDDLEVVALQGLNLEVARGEMIALVGASGSGKSTLLNILGGLDVPTAGKVSVAGYDLNRLNEEQSTRYRNLVVGHLWQQSGRNLLPDLTIAGNVNLPQLLKGVHSAKYKRRTQQLLEIVSLGSMGKKKPFQLSGGEQQRAALAVSLANEPSLLLADEPTGELDTATTREIIAFMRQLNTELNLTIIIVTHDVVVASEVDRTLAIRDGRTSTETIRRQQPLTGTQSILQQASSTIGLPQQTHQELIFIDRVGILQLPAAGSERLVQDGRAEVQVIDGHVELWPAGLLDQESTGTSTVIGLSLTSHAETVLVDRSARLQLPRAVIEQFNFQGRVEVRNAGQHLELWPAPLVVNHHQSKTFKAQI